MILPVISSGVDPEQLESWLELPCLERDGAGYAGGSHLEGGKMGVFQ